LSALFLCFLLVSQRSHLNDNNVVVKSAIYLMRLTHIWYKVEIYNEGYSLKVKLTNILSTSIVVFLILFSECYISAKVLVRITPLSEPFRI
jgi:hypothetical protein